MALRNLDVRDAIRAAGVRHWEVAERLGVREETLCRKLRHELSDNEKKKLLRAVEQLKKEKEV